MVLSSILPPSTAYAEHVDSTQAGIRLDTQKVAHVMGEVSPKLSKDFIAEVQKTASIPGDRLILINSPGGQSDAGDDIIHVIEDEKRLGVRQVCLVTHEAASMAFDILTHCDVRLALPGSWLLAHKLAALGINCATERCTALRLRDIARDIERDDRPYDLANARAMHLTLKQYNVYAEHDRRWRPDALLKLGYLHGIAALRK